jgi:GH18 family chitinase
MCEGEVFFSSLNGITQLSLDEKALFVRSKNLRGVSMWEVSGDYDNILIDSLVQGLSS